MLSRVIFNHETDTPVVFSQDFLRSDYARIHTDVIIEEIGSSYSEDAPGKEGA
jgi:hypothetical protein